MTGYAFLIKNGFYLSVEINRFICCCKKINSNRYCEEKNDQKRLTGKNYFHLQAIIKCPNYNFFRRDGLGSGPVLNFSILWILLIKVIKIYKVTFFGIG